MSLRLPVELRGADLVVDRDAERAEITEKGVVFEREPAMMPASEGGSGICAASSE